MQKKGIIQIELRSDLCVASGYSYDGVIDTDICYDAFGLPYIPAKRLKGCFRETAESILHSVLSEKDRDEIFGSWGASSVRGLMLGNAYIRQYEELKKEIRTILEDHETYDVSPQRILEQFTHVQAQTAIGYPDDREKGSVIYDGSAKDNTLRFTRVVDQYSPLTQENMIFEADVVFEAELQEKIKQILIATKHIGLKRNRGFGSVKCRLTQVTDIREPLDQCDQGAVENAVSQEDGENVRIEYRLTNTEPLVLSDKDDNKTIDYIKGQMILGALASKYLAIKGNSAEDQTFQDLFLNGTTVFSNAVPCKDGKVYYPAPLFVNQLKKTKEIVNSIFVDPKRCQNGNLPKKLKGKYVYADQDFQKVAALEVEKQLCYHHSHKSIKNKGQKDVLFPFEAIREGQSFAGSVTLPAKYEKLVKELLQNGLRIGKSRSAQYGSCEVELDGSSQEQFRTFSKGDKIIVTLQSDMILHNGTDYTVFYDEVRRLVAEQLGIPVAESGEDYSILNTKELTGYLSVWNMRKSPVPAIAAGSMLSYCLAEDFEMIRESCGERCLEGFGKVRIDRLDATRNMEDQGKKKQKEDPEKKDGEQINENRAAIKLTKPLFSKIFMHDLEMELILTGISDSVFKVSASKLGRVTLMLKESLDENPGNYQNAFCNFKERVDSIKSDDRELINREIVRKISSDQENVNLKVDKDRLPSWTKLRQIGFCEDECDDKLNSLWGRYVLMILTNQKYENKIQGGDRR